MATQTVGLFLAQMRSLEGLLDRLLEGCRAETGGRAMLRKILHVTSIGLTVVVQLPSAYGQWPSARDVNGQCVRYICEHPPDLRWCDKPLNGATLFSGRVVALAYECQHMTVSLRVDDAPANDLPVDMEIEVGPCVRFYGKLGESIRVAVAEPHSFDRRRYKLSCDFR